MNYYLFENNETKGPYTLGQLRSMWHNGVITSQTLHCYEGGTAWQPLKVIQHELEPPIIAAPSAATGMTFTRPALPVGKVECGHCHAIVTPQSMAATTGTIVITILLLCLMIIPGIIYIIWESSRKQCPQCGLPLK